MKVHYTLSNKVNDKTGKSEVMIRLIVSSKSSFRSPSGIFITPRCWDNDKESPRTGMKAPMSTECELTRARLNKVTELLIEEGRKHTNDTDTKWMKRLMMRVSFDGKEMMIAEEKNENALTFSYLIQEQVAQLINEKRDSSARFVYAPFLKKWEQYEKKVGKTFYADDFTEQDVYDFVDYCMKNEKHKQNYRCTAISIARTTWNSARARHSELAKLSFKSPTPVLGSAIYLNKEQRNAIYNANIKDDKLARYRDLFILQCLIGCRVSDLMKLTAANIQDGYCVYIAIKTRNRNPKTISTPLHHIAKEIIERYRDGDNILPIKPTTTYSYNKYIKKIISEVKSVDKEIITLDPYTRLETVCMLHEIASSHMARRTFIGCLHEEGFSEFDICSISGHIPGSISINRYRSVSDSRKKKMIESI